MTHIATIKVRVMCNREGRGFPNPIRPVVMAQITSAIDNIDWDDVVENALAPKLSAREDSSLTFENNSETTY